MAYRSNRGPSYEGITFSSVIFAHLMRMSEQVTNSYTQDPISSRLMIDNYREMILWLRSLLSPFIIEEEEDVWKAINDYDYIRLYPAKHNETYMKGLRDFFSVLVDIMHKNDLLIPPQEASTLEDVENVPGEIIIRGKSPKSKSG